MKEEQAKLEELMKDAAFVNAMFSKENSEEVQKLFAEKGVALTMEEVESLASAILQAAPAENGELSEDALDSVAGGRFIRLPFFPIPIPIPIPYYPRPGWPWRR